MKKKWILVIAVLLLIPIVPFALYFGYSIYVYQSLKSKMPPEYWAEYDSFVNKRWTFDPADLYPEPFAPETIEAAREFRRVLQESNDEIKDLGQWEDVRAGKIISIPVTDTSTTQTNLSNEDLGRLIKGGSSYVTLSSLRNREYRKVERSDILSMDELMRRAESLRPVLGAWARLVDKPDYDMEVLAVTNDPLPDFLGVPGADTYSLHQAFDLAIMLGHYQNHSQRHHETLDLMETMSKGLRSHTHALLFIWYARFVQLRNLFPVWLEAVQGCEDPARLRQTLLVLDSLREPSDYQTTGTIATVRSAIGAVRVASRAGIHFDVQNQTAYEIVPRVTLDLEREYAEKITLPNASDDIRQKIEEKYREYRGGPLDYPVRMSPRHIIQDLVARKMIRRTLFSMLLIGSDTVTDYVKLSITSLGLLRVETAARIYELEKGSRPETMEALVPEYLDAIPVDLFRPDGGSVLWKEGRPYSVGPDGVDDGMVKSAVFTDPQEPGGDVFLKKQSELDRPIKILK